MEFFDLNDEIYREQFERTYYAAKNGLTENRDKDIQILQSTIATLFDCQGLDWIGRGEIYLVKSNATIAATETVLQELLEKADGTIKKNHRRVG